MCAGCLSGSGQAFPCKSTQLISAFCGNHPPRGERCAISAGRMCCRGRIAADSDSSPLFRCGPVCQHRETVGGSIRPPTYRLRWLPMARLRTLVRRLPFLRDLPGRMFCLAMVQRPNAPLSTDDICARSRHFASFPRPSAICFSIQSWLRSSTARISAATTALRFRVSWLSCSDSPEIDQLVEPVTV